MRDHTKNILIVIMACVIAGSILYGVGYAMGIHDTYNYGFKILQRLMELKKVNIDIDWDMLKLGVQQYKNNINGCLFIDNSVIGGT